jgi:hypothetical protein
LLTQPFFIFVFFLLCVGFLEPNGTPVVRSNGGQLVGKVLVRRCKRNKWRHIGTAVIAVLVTTLCAVGLLHGKPSKEHQLNCTFGHGSFAFCATGRARVSYTIAQNDEIAFEAQGVTVDHLGSLNVEDGIFPVAHLFVCFPIRRLAVLAAVHAAFTGTTKECCAHLVAYAASTRFFWAKLLQQLSWVLVVMLKQRRVLFHGSAVGTATEQRLQLLVFRAGVAQENVVSFFWVTRVALEHRFDAAFLQTIQQRGSSDVFLAHGTRDDAGCLSHMNASADPHTSPFFLLHFFFLDKENFLQHKPNNFIVFFVNFL